MTSKKPSEFPTDSYVHVDWPYPTSEFLTLNLYFTFLSHLFPLPCGAGSTVPHEGFDSSVIMSFSWCVVAVTLPIKGSPHPVSSLHIYTFVVSRAFMADAASQAGDADFSRAPGLTSSFQGSVNVHRGVLLLVPQCQCIISFVVLLTLIKVWPWKLL